MFCSCSRWATSCCFVICSRSLRSITYCYVLFPQSLDYQLGQTQKLADMYREQVMQLEDQLARIREEGDVGKELFKVVTACVVAACGPPWLKYSNLTVY